MQTLLPRTCAPHISQDYWHHFCTLLSGHKRAGLPPVSSCGVAALLPPSCIALPDPCTRLTLLRYITAGCMRQALFKMSAARIQQGTAKPESVVPRQPSNHNTLEEFHSALRFESGSLSHRQVFGLKENSTWSSMQVSITSTGSMASVTVGRYCSLHR